MSADARQYYKSGPPFLQRYLPFWMAVLAARTLVVLIPFLALFYPLIRSAPFLYDWRVQRKISKLYQELKLLEVNLDEPDPPFSVGELIAQLDDLEKRALKLKIPSFYSHLPYTLVSTSSSCATGLTSNELAPGKGNPSKNTDYRQIRQMTD